MTQDESKIREAVNEFCEQHGGGPREIEITRGRFGGYYVTLIWDGFISMGLGDRFEGISQALIKHLGASTFHVVSRYRVYTFAEKIEAEAFAETVPPFEP